MIISKERVVAGVQELVDEYMHIRSEVSTLRAEARDLRRQCAYLKASNKDLREKARGYQKQLVDIRSEAQKSKPSGWAVPQWVEAVA